MWNISFELPLVMILGIILAFFFSRPRLGLRRSRIFLNIVIIETLTILTDLVACSVDNDYAAYTITTVKIVNALYFVAFFSRAYMLYLFATTVMKDTLEKDAAIRVLIRLPMHAGVILTLISGFFGSWQFTHVIFYADGYGYHSGQLYNMVYVCGFYYVLLSFISLFLYRRKLGRRREKYSMFFYNLIIFVALILRLALPNFLVMDTFIFMAILVVFLAFENPEYYLDLKGATFNSLAFNEHLTENISNLKEIPIGVAVYNYHEMSEVYGYMQTQAGLVIIGRYLKQLFPKTKVFYYRNGRFIVLAPSGADINAKVQEITERFGRPLRSAEAELYLSVGIALFDLAKAEYSAEIIARTMVNALDEVGRTGNVTTFFEESLSRTEKEKYVKKCIENALETRSLELYLQPIVDTSTGKVVGAEALSRIKDLDGKIIPPGIFIPIAENSGRINELGELVFEKACEFMRESGGESKNIEWINVNLSPAQFVRTDLAERYVAIIDKYELDRDKVHLEITEGCMIDDAFLQKQMNTMTESGFKFVLDDYGTGYSNLSRLKKCPFINIKLDMSIVWDYCKEPEEILPNMIQAFKYMGFKITAEGVENLEMADTMKNIGCDFLQGYYYSKPIPQDEFISKYMS